MVGDRRNVALVTDTTSSCSRGHECHSDAVVVTSSASAAPRTPSREPAPPPPPPTPSRCRATPPVSTVITMRPTSRPRLPRRPRPARCPTREERLPRRRDIPVGKVQGNGNASPCMCETITVSGTVVGDLQDGASTASSCRTPGTGRPPPPTASSSTRPPRRPRSRRRPRSPCHGTVKRVRRPDRARLAKDVVGQRLRAPADTRRAAAAVRPTLSARRSRACWSLRPPT